MIMMTTTTERTSATHPPAASNLRLYLIAFLATAYLLAWWLFGGRTPASHSDLVPSEPAPETSRGPRVAAWYHDIPPSQRPAVDLPAGWHIVTVQAPG